MDNDTAHQQRIETAREARWHYEMYKRGWRRGDDGSYAHGNVVLKPAAVDRWIQHARKHGDNQTPPPF